MPSGDAEATHLVVNELALKELPSDLCLPHFIVRGEASHFYFYHTPNFSYVFFVKSMFWTPQRSELSIVFLTPVELYRLCRNVI